jgi:ribosomal protein S27E
MFETGKVEMACKSCGAINIVPYKDYPEKDKGIVDCAGCGQELHKWKGTRDFGIANLKEEEPDKE